MHQQCFEIKRHSSVDCYSDNSKAVRDGEVRGAGAGPVVEEESPAPHSAAGGRLDSNSPKERDPPAAFGMNSSFAVGLPLGFFYLFLCSWCWSVDEKPETVGLPYNLKKKKFIFKIMVDIQNST